MTTNTPNNEPPPPTTETAPDIAALIFDLVFIHAHHRPRINKFILGW
jgi:hypothetical protein